jgi:hypothetical protein
MECNHPFLSILSNRFLLAHLHMTVIEEQINQTDIIKALDDLPEDLEGTYDGIIERIRNQPKPRARCAEQALMWLTYAKEPLHERVLQHALAVEPDSKTFDFRRLTVVNHLVSICAGLVTMDAESGIIHLVHYTTHDYLRGLYPDAEINIAKTCITYLGLDIFNEPCTSEMSLDERLSHFACSTYAAKYWAEHTRGNNEREIQSSLLKLFRLRGKRESMSQIQIYSSGRWKPFADSIGQSLLHIVAANGLATVCISLLREGFDDNDLYILGSFTTNRK